MRKFILSLIITQFILITDCFGQLELKADKFSFRELKDSTWTQFSDWQDTNVNVIINNDPNRIEIFDDPKLTYTILSENSETKTEKDERVLSYNCEDGDCNKCHIIMIEKTNKNIYLVIYYTNMNFIYNVIEP
jgi:hypothetical protein